MKTRTFPSWRAAYFQEGQGYDATRSWHCQPEIYAGRRRTLDTRLIHFDFNILPSTTTCSDFQCGGWKVKNQKLFYLGLRVQSCRWTFDKSTERVKPKPHECFLLDEILVDPCSYTPQPNTGSGSKSSRPPSSWSYSPISVAMTTAWPYIHKNRAPGAER